MKRVALMLTEGQLKLLDRTAKHVGIGRSEMARRILDLVLKPKKGKRQ